MHNGGTTENPEAALVSQRQKELLHYRPGRCFRARKRLKAVFQMRKYYLAVLGLSGMEALLVIIRLILETESLRYPPGSMYTAILDTQLAFACISLPTLVLFLLEQPFKWWAFGSRRFCKSVLLVLDALICIACFSLNVYNIHMLANRPKLSLASTRQLALCGTTHTTEPPDTAHTFAIVMGFIIVYRFWCIRGYVDKSVKSATGTTIQKLHSTQQLLDDSRFRIAQLEIMLQEQNGHKHGRGSLKTRSSSQTKSFTRRSGQDPRYSRSNGDREEVI